jgi:hypothetical protein
LAGFDTAALPGYKFLVATDNEPFPSGPWVGFYLYSGRPDKHRMDLALTFANGTITGEGNDDVGAFVIRGRYDARSRECHWTKTYLGAHDVYYRGFREGKGIWGTWEIELDAHGGFHIWPRAHGETESESEKAQAEQPIEAVATACLLCSARPGRAGRAGRRGRALWPAL